MAARVAKAADGRRKISGHVPSNPLLRPDEWRHAGAALIAGRLLPPPRLPATGETTYSFLMQDAGPQYSPLKPPGSGRIISGPSVVAVCICRP